MGAEAGHRNAIPTLILMAAPLTMYLRAIAPYSAGCSCVAAGGGWRRLAFCAIQRQIT